MATLPQQLVCEFIGTFILVLTVCCSIMSGSPLASISIACSLMVGIYSLGSVSGAHFNPAVSGGLWLSGLLGHAGLKDFTLVKSTAYKLVQGLAGVCAAVCAGSLYGCSLFGLGSASNIVNGTVVVADTAQMLDLATSFPVLNAENGYAIWSKMLAEAFYTCMLVFTVLNTATNPTSKEKGNHYFGLSIGFVIMAGANGIGHVSGCALNPAVSLGLAVGSMIFGSAEVGAAIISFILYCVAEAIGALLAVGLFHAVRNANIKKRTDSKEGTRAESMLSKCVAEVTGTFYLVLTVGLVCSDASAPVLGVVGIASSLMVMIYCLGQVSGANFNPAVTLALGLRGVLPWIDVVKYWLSQLWGGLFAVGMVAAIEAGKTNGGYNVALIASTPSIGGVTVAGRGTWGQIIEAEFIFTFLLVFAVLNTAVADAPNNYFGLAIGMCITVGGVAVGGLSGGCFNPAVSFALGMGGMFAKGNGGANAWFFIYWIAQFLGAAAAAGIAGFVRKEEEEDEETEEDGGLLA